MLRDGSWASRNRGLPRITLLEESLGLMLEIPLQNVLWMIQEDWKKLKRLAAAPAAGWVSALREEGDARSSYRFVLICSFLSSGCFALLFGSYACISVSRGQSLQDGLVLAATWAGLWLSTGPILVVFALAVSAVCSLVFRLFSIEHSIARQLLCVNCYCVGIYLFGIAFLDPPPRAGVVLLVCLWRLLPVYRLLLGGGAVRRNLGSAGLSLIVVGVLYSCCVCLGVVRETFGFVPFPMLR